MLSGAAKEDVSKRLRRIEGQIAGLSRMVDEEQYCVDILNQVAAVQGALNRVAQQVLLNHVDTCVRDALKRSSGKDRARKIEEVINVLHRYGKM